ncbi:alpha/beta fold hydrolase [uncultured Caulobacter sp.]|uniref:alpha/beta fold hydrolase n=1 Tax=uncultured Caulobacter sp. TaxID=158749 RepID=UPI002618136F|nr:alpha/beta fold hydrolase [uncultured Caulobacter sp.]
MHDQSPLTADRTSALPWRGGEVARAFLEVGGHALAYAEVGQGRPLVLIHGTLTTLDDMALALSDLLAPGRRLIAVDRPGFGRSGRDRLSGAGIFAQARGLWRGLDQLGVERPIIVGHSFGASVAVAMAVLRPAAVAGVVALAPLVIPEWRLEHLIFGPRAWPGSGDLLAATAHAGLDRGLLPILWRAMFLPQAMPPSMTRAFPFDLAGEAAATMRIGEDCLAVGPELLALLARVGALDVPLEILGGDSDLVVNNTLHGRLLAALAPRARFSPLPGVGHMIHHAAPEVVAAAVERLERAGSA